jgi:C4-dicarboxylate-binding protein DctP
MCLGDLSEYKKGKGGLEMERWLKYFLAVAIPIFLAVPTGWAQTADSAKKIMIKLSHGYPTGYIRHQSAMKFKEILEKETNGRVVVQVYPAGQLYKIADEGEALAMGNVQMIAATGGSASKFVGEWNVFSIQTAFDTSPTNIKHLLDFEDSEVCRKYITSKLEPKGIRFIGFFPTCTIGLISTMKKPIRKMEDYKGLKIINAFGKIAVLHYDLLGVSSLAIPVTERVMALSTGMVDGEIGNVDNTLSQRYPIKYIHEWWGTHSGANMMMNLEFWSGLPPDIKKIITDKAVPQARAWTISQVMSIEAAARNKLKSQGVEFVEASPEFRNQILAKTEKPVRDFFIKQYPVNGPIILNEVARLDPRKK